MNYRVNFFFLVLFVITACSSVPKFTKDKWKSSPEHPEEKIENEIAFNNPPTVLETVVGIASYYAHEFNGKETANGEIYDMYGLTAAHNTYPFGTIIQVTNLENSKSVMIRINDRMPKHPARIVDLSYGTAIQLDMLRSGITKVKLEILQWGEE